MSAVLDGAREVLVPTNLLALIAFGLLTGRSAGPNSRVTLASFAIGLLAGALLIALGLRDPPAANVLLALAASIGVIVAIGSPLPQIIQIPVAFATGTAIALNAPPQAVTLPTAIAAQFGSGIAALAATGVVAFVTLIAQNGWQRFGLRIVGSWMAASAILVLALRLAR
jgi:hypothetical protein